VGIANILEVRDVDQERAAVVAIAALAALVVPVAANAEAKNWLHSGSLLTKNAEITFTGTHNFTSSAGGVSCTIKSSITLEPGSTATITSHEPSATNTCTYSGNLDNLCGTVDSHASTGLPWTGHGFKISASTYKIIVTNYHTDVGGTGIFCPDVTVKGTPTQTLTERKFWFDTTHYHGQMESNLGTTVTAGGTTSASPGGGHMK
jgi:hypothetical protein